MPQTLKFDIKLTKKQQEIYNAVHEPKYNEVVCCMSRQSGKSIIAEVLCIEYLFKKQSRILYVVPTFSHARKVYNDIVSILPVHWIKSQNGSTLTIETTVGGKLQFFSAESPVSLRGQTGRGLIVVDECAFIPDTTSDGQDFFGSILFATRKAKRPTVLYISTPRGKQGFFYKHFMKAAESGNRMKQIKATIYDDELVTSEEIDDIRDSISDLSFRQEFLCEFLDNGLSAFSGYEAKFTLKKQIDFSEPLWGAVDFSSVGTDKTVLTLMNKNYDVWQWQIDGTLDEKYRKIADLLNKCKKLVVCYLETNGVGEPMLNEVRKRAKKKSKLIGWCTTNDSKQDEVSLLQALLDKDIIHFEESNTLLKNECGVFTYSITKSKRITYSAMTGFHDDRVMSLLLAVQAKEDYAYSNGSNMVYIKSRNKMDMR